MHRLVQESLTNARKHAPGAPVRVSVRYGPPLSTVEVGNGPGTVPQEPVVTSGYGLIGLAERVAALNGRLHYGPSGSGGWTVTAELPVDQTADVRTAGAAE